MAVDALGRGYDPVSLIDPTTGLPVSIGGASGGSVTSAGTNGTQAQAVQGISGGVPQPVIVNSGSSVIGSTTLRFAGFNRSATVGTTASVLMAANGNRQGWKIKNDTASDIWINFDATATATPGGGNIKIAAGAYLASEPGFVETGAMSVIGAAANLAITAREH